MGFKPSESEPSLPSGGEHSYMGGTTEPQSMRKFEMMILP